MAELEFWDSKARHLNSIQAQLASDKIRKVLSFLTLTLKRLTLTLTLTLTLKRPTLTLTLTLTLSAR